jgi:hypothetical protein
LDKTTDLSRESPAGYDEAKQTWKKLQKQSF